MFLVGNAQFDHDATKTRMGIGLFRILEFQEFLRLDFSRSAGELRAEVLTLGIAGTAGWGARWRAFSCHFLWLTSVAYDRYFFHGVYRFINQYFMIDMINIDQWALNCSSNIGSTDSQAGWVFQGLNLGFSHGFSTNPVGLEPIL